MELTVVTGSAAPRLGAAIADALDVRLAETTLERFPDGECHVTLRHHVRGHDVYVVQPTCPPVDALLVEGDAVRGVRTTPTGLDRERRPTADYGEPTDVTAKVTVPSQTRTS